VLITARPGDSIEIGLHTSGKPTSGGNSDHPSDSTSYSTTSSASGDSPTRTEEGPVVCTFDIAHKYTSLSANGILSDDSFSDPQNLESGSEMRSPQPTESRSEPQFDSLILRRLLKLVGGTLRTSLQPKVFQRGRRCELSVILERGPPLSVLDERTLSDEEAYRQTFSDIRLAREPSIDELTGFVETLRGKKVAFHASSQGSFAHHLTRYLTAWGMDISHVPTDCLEEEKDLVECTSNSRAQSQYGLAASPGVGAGISNGDIVPPIADGASDGPSESKPTSSESDLSLIIIDDDVQGLRRRLLQHRAETMPNLQPHSRKRPSLAANHRPRSSPSVRSALLTVGSPPSQQQLSPPSTFTPVPIVHFTSLANYKLVKDVIQGMIFDYTSLLLVPEVIVIPKPAGPRRILMALHTAIYKPYVDPFFSPIATSPMSPGGTIPPFLSGRKPTSASTPPSSLRSGTERLPRAGSDSATTMAPPSPHLIPEGLEYFSEASVKTLGGNAASGLVIQSPDGRPAGIFFQPQSRMPSSKTELTTTTTERERTAFRPASQRISRRNISRKTGVDNGGATDISKETIPRHRSPSAKPLLDVAALSRLSISSAASPSLDRPRYGQVTGLQSSFRGKGRSRGNTVEQEESRVLTSAAWREATQNLAKPPPNPKTSLDFTPVSAVSSSATQSPVTDSTPLSPTRLPCNPGIAAAPMSRSANSPTSPESKKPVARRATQGARSPVVSTTMKKSKTVGNNIVPPISVLIVEGELSPSQTFHHLSISII
jgi:osomolarity two-component system, response regulator SSK1